MPKIPEKKVKTMEPVDMTTVRFGCNDFPKPYWMADAGNAMLYHGHVIGQLKRMPARSVHTVITSPPYFNLRDYKTGEWEGGVEGCDHLAPFQPRSDDPNVSGCGIGKGGAYADEQAKGSTMYRHKCGKCGAKRIDQQIGAEPLHDCGTLGKAQCGRCFVCTLVAVCREVYRVLRDDGVFFLNLGDTYGDGGNLCGVPWRVAIALQSDGWVLRSDMPWVRRNSMPESCDNRPNKSLEYFFMLVKSDDYYFDMEAVRKKAASEPHAPGNKKLDESRNDHDQMEKVWGADGNRNYRNSDLWFASIEDPHGVTGVGDEIVGIDTPTRGYSGSHFACVDEKTEALTKTGWKKHTELTNGDEIATYDKYNYVLGWERATFHRYDYDGLMVSFDKRDTSQLLTPNHKCLIQSKKGVLKAKEAEYINTTDQFLMCADFKEDYQTSIGEDMAELVGWFTSEGWMCVDKDWIPDKYPVAICQSETVNKPNVDRIHSLLIRMKANFKIRKYKDVWKGVKNTMVVFHVGGEVGQVLAYELCRGDKKITDEMTRLPINEMRALLLAFVAGDGHTRPEDGRMSIIQKDKHRIEQLQIIATKLGYRAQLGQRKNGLYNLYITSGRLLNACGTNRISIKKKVPYKGVVWCPSVPSGFWMARRNGKPFITGNTYSPKLIEPFILAGTSEYGCCDACGKQYERMVSKSGGTEVTEDRKMDRSFASQRNGLPGSIPTLTGVPSKSTVGWRQSCVCRNASVEPCIILDPFVGSGTTPATAVQHGRKGIGIDLNETYLIDHAIPRVTNAIKGAGVVKSKKVEVVIQANDVPKAKNVFGRKG